MNRRNFITTLGTGAATGIVGGSRAGAAEAAPPAAGGEAEFVQRTDVTPYVVDFIAGTRYSDLPADVIALGKKSILDSFGLAIVGSKSKGGQILRAYLDSLGCAGGKVRVLGTSDRLPLRFAAMANAASIHLEDFDDSQRAAGHGIQGLLPHPSAPVFSAVLGTADTITVSGRDFLTAYHVGVEVLCKIAEACAPRAYQGRFQSTGIFSVFGSAAGCAKLRRFDAELIGRTLPIAANHASGLSKNFGTLMKPYQVGHAAEAGVVAADLAGLGWDGSANVLEATGGFFHSFGGAYDPGSILNKLGKPWTFASPGISIKPYPNGTLAHPGMTEMARLIRDHGIKAADVAQVEVGTNSQMPKSLHQHRPKKGLEGKFSMEYCMAVLLIVGKAGLSEFTDAVVSRPDIQEMMQRVRFYTDPVAEAASNDKLTTLIEISLKDGRVFSGRAEFAKGSPQDPMSYDEVADKFRGCAEYAGWPADRSERIIDGVRHLEDLPDVSALTALCVT